MKHLYPLRLTYVVLLFVLTVASTHPTSENKKSNFYQSQVTNLTNSIKSSIKYKAVHNSLFLEANAVCQTVSSDDYEVNLNSLVTNQDGSISYSYDITLYADRALSHVRFQMPYLSTAQSPSNNGSYYGNRNNFNIENPSNNGFWNINFETLGEGIKNGQSETFEYTLTSGTAILDSISVELKYGPTYQVFKISTANCNPTNCNGFNSLGTIDLIGSPCGNIVINSTSSPSGGAGSIEYRWQERTYCGGSWSDWQTVVGQSSQDYSPGFVAKETQFRRQARRMPCTEWESSNLVNVGGCDICGNGIDDDCDNLVDNYDGDCPCSNLGVPNINFDVDALGQPVNSGDVPYEYWAAWGVHITSHNPGNHAPMIFDSENPTGNDFDLGTKNETFGGAGRGVGGEDGRPGANTQLLGNALIVSENNNSSNPDDNAGGGTLIFEFDNAMPIASIEIVDVDYGETDGRIKVYDNANAMIAEYPIIAYGDNSYQKIALQITGVYKMSIEFPGSGSITAVNFCDSSLPTSSIGNMVWMDQNHNGLIDGLEQGLEGAEVELFDQFGNLLAEHTTDASGTYEFSNLVNDEYIVKVTPPNDAYRCTKDLDNNRDGDSELFMLSASRMDVDFGFGLVEICNNNIDDDFDGLQDGEDPDCCTNLQLIPQTNWNLHFVDSEETAGENAGAINAFDGNINTIWHTGWQGGNDPMPHEIQIDLGASYKVAGLRYLPRQDGGTNGRIEDYEIYVSPDGNNWGLALVAGTWSYSDAAEKEVSFQTAIGRYVRLRATSAVGGNPWASAAEINILECSNAENCGNGIDDDGDTLVDGNDPDCSCAETVIYIAQDGGNIASLNINTGVLEVATNSPYTNGNLNALSANPDGQIIYYGRNKSIYYWNPQTDVHGELVDLTGQIASSESFTSGGGAYYNGSIYMGAENDNNSWYPEIYRIPVSEDGLSVTGNAQNLNVPIQYNSSWGDMIVTGENGKTVIYGGLGADSKSIYFKYTIETASYTLLRDDMPAELQIGVDINGDIWGGALQNGELQRFSKTNGNFYGTTLNVAGWMWDLTGPLNCPQAIEICDNGLDDDGDGLIDCQDSDCYLSLYSSTNVPINISSNSSGTYTSTINVTESETIEDLNLTDLSLSHSYIDDLTLTLTSPSGTMVTLMEHPCNSENDIFIEFDDEAPSANYPCPPTNGNAYRSVDNLSAFDGENMQGIWILTIQDDLTNNGGQLERWTLAFTKDCSTQETCGNGIDDDGDGRIDEECSPCKLEDITNCGLQIHPNENDAVDDINSEIPAGECAPEGYFDLTPYDLFVNGNQSYELCVTYTTEDFSRMGVKNILVQNPLCTDEVVTYEMIQTSNGQSATLAGADINGTNLGLQYFDVQPNTEYRICVTIQYDNSDNDCENPRTGQNDPEICSTTFHVFPVGQPEICDNNIDDDLDGLIDCLDPECGGSELNYAQSVVYDNGVENEDNAIGSPDGSYAKLYDSSDRLTLDLGKEIGVGQTYTVVWRRKNYSNNSTADMVIEESSDNSNFTTQPYKPATTNKTSFVSTEVTANVATRYLRLRTETGSNDDFELDAISFAVTCQVEICDNGIDDDGDGLVDCADPECGFNSVEFTSTPVNCANGGTIDLEVISAYEPHRYIWSDMLAEAHYTFEENTDDISGNNNHNNGIGGTLAYSNDAVEGRTSLEFDGTNNVRYSIDGGLMEVPFRQLSVMFWMKPASLSGTQMLFEEGGGTNGIIVNLDGDQLKAAVRAGGSGSEVNPGSLTVPNDGAWHHVALIYDKGAITLFLDGVAGTTSQANYELVPSHGSNGGLATNFSGCATGTCGSNYVGLIDDFRYFFERAITPSQISDIARNDGDRNDLTAGTYQVNITNNHGCERVENVTITAEINQIQGLEVNVTTDGADTNPGDGICDDGTCNCSLRAAMEEANAYAGYDTITFNIPGAGPFVIQPLADLPTITERVFINGLSQNGATSENLKISVDGSNMGGDKGIFYTIADQTKLQGLAIYGHTGTPSAAGVALQSADNEIVGNLIGLTVGGTSPSANSNGVRIIGGNNNTIGGVGANRNIISGNTYNGLLIEKEGVNVPNNNIILNNYIGTNRTGISAIGNGTNGLDNGIATNTIVLSNIISGNGNDGIEIDGTDANNMASGVMIQDNQIGLGSDGTAMGNGFRGIYLEYAKNIQIGGVESGAANSIANNTGAGLEIIKTESKQNIILMNTFANNGGIAIDLANGVNGDGVTLNDPNDMDEGANDLVNYPEAQHFILREDTLDYSIEVDVPLGNYRIEFFRNTSQDPSGHGEGESFVKAIQINHDGTGPSTTFGSIFPEIPINGGDYVSMTITTCTDGACTHFEQTSEFSGWTEVNDCINYTDAGAISGAEENCTSYNPGIINGTILPSGGSGDDPVYQWQKSTDSLEWSDVLGAVFEVYDPPTITESTWYRRGTRRPACPEFIYSNAVKKEVVYNVTSAGTITGDEVSCGNLNAGIMTNVTEAFGGIAGVIQYQWQQSTDNGLSWQFIDGENEDHYTPGFLTQTTLYKRSARRYPCLTWINSNIIVKQVKVIPDAEILEYPTGNNGFLCEDNTYTFKAKNVGNNVQYEWHFGNYATPATATGPGPHQVTYDVPDNSGSHDIDVLLSTNLDGCTAADIRTLKVRPYLEITNVTPADPTNCWSFFANGTIDVEVNNPSNSDFQISINGGLSWGAVNQTFFTSLRNDNYDIWIRYSNGDCPINFGAVTLSEPAAPLARIYSTVEKVCLGEQVTFEAADSARYERYNWDFGEGATSRYRSGKGPHVVLYTTSGVKNVQLNVTHFVCSAVDNSTVEIVENFSDAGEIGGAEVVCDDEIPALLTNQIFPTGGSEGDIEYQWESRTQDTLNNWSGWEEIVGANTFNYAPVILEGPTEYRRKARRAPCDWVISNVIAKGLSTKPKLKDDLYPTACPGFIYADNVADNDENLVDPTFYIYLNPANGSLDLDQDGEFIYTPNSTFCGSDQFVYVVCNQGSACCDTATVVLDLSDNAAPDLLNIPVDVTLHCDDEVPSPPLVQAWENCQSVTIGLDEESTWGSDSCAINNYVLTRTWTGIDYCGNYVADKQTLTILDETAPDIFRIYTLPNGKRMVAGVIENVTHRWKTVRLPIQFTGRPVVLTQVISNDDLIPITPKLRNVSTTQFQLQLREQEAEDNVHQEEKVAWIAIEEGFYEDDLALAAKTSILSSAYTKVNLGQPYAETPMLFGSIQSTNETDPFTLRIDSLTQTDFTAWAQEEQSADNELSHGIETLGFLSIGKEGLLHNENGEVFGEVGSIQLNNNKQTIQLTNKYHNPVVIMGSVANSDPAQVMTRVLNVTATSFEVFLQEWNYQDGVHGDEFIPYFVVEGSIPFDQYVDCSNVPEPLEIGTEIIAVDNCDNTVYINFVEESGNFNCVSDTTITRRWSSVDECGNAVSFSQTLTLFDTLAPDFTVPTTVTILCDEDIHNLALTGDVMDESDNCATDIEATYEDDVTNQNGCAGYVERTWTLTDACGNATSKIQLIQLYTVQNGDRDFIPDVIDLDDDNDGIPDVIETTADTDNDGIANYLDLDSDNDGISDLVESGGIDADGDGLVDNLGNPLWDEDYDGFTQGYDTNDNNPDEAASTERDYTDETWDKDQDGIPNHLDLDSDNDGIPDIIEAGGVDTDGNGVYDYPIPSEPMTMPDGDGDGFADDYDTDDDGLNMAEDAFESLLLRTELTIYTGNPSVSPDIDNDGLPNHLDLDCDNDGIPDLIEAGGIDTDGNGKIDDDEFEDTDNNGFNDNYSLRPLIITEGDGTKEDGRPEDTNNDGTPYIGGDADQDGILNILDTDADGDNINDILEVGYGKWDSDNDGQLDDMTDENNDGLDDNLVSSRGIYTEGEGTVDDGLPEDGPDDNVSKYASSNTGITIEPFIDSDGDGILNSLDEDSDNDLILDITEDKNSNGQQDTGETNYLNPDTDEDGIPDGMEDVNRNGVTEVTEMNPLTNDTDGDTFEDGVEDVNLNGILDIGETNPVDPCEPVFGSKCFGVTLNIRLKLQGALIDSDENGLMRDDLRKRRFLPLTEPYMESPNLHHVGEGGNEKIEESVLTITGNNAMVDWVLIELRSVDLVDSIVATRSGILQRDGDVVDIDGGPIKFLRTPSGDYHVAVRHRNHLGIVTRSSYFLSPNPRLIDFTDNSTLVFGDFAINNRIGERAMWSGDLNSDRRVIFQGPENDIFDLFLDVIVDEENVQSLSNYIGLGYLNTDLNMDGESIFQGPNNDRSKLIFNVTLESPENDGMQANFVVDEEMPEIVNNTHDNPCYFGNRAPECDFDQDGLPNEIDEDDDNDGVLDINDVSKFGPESDSDGDGLTDFFETGGDGIYHPGVDTNPLSEDTDNDFLPDGMEDANLNRIVDKGETDPLNPDSDGDGFLDGREDKNQDGELVAGETNPVDRCDPNKTHPACDYDGDGYINFIDLDDDDDGVVDLKDADPFNKYSDSDGDGYSDYAENGGDGVFHPTVDSRPLDACDPDPYAGGCIGVDKDLDGFYSNFPIGHQLFDPNDELGCIPNPESEACGCPDTDGDGYIMICHQSPYNLNDRESVLIPVDQWPLHAAHGDKCGPCSN